MPEDRRAPKTEHMAIVPPMVTAVSTREVQEHPIDPTDRRSVTDRLLAERRSRTTHATGTCAVGTHAVDGTRSASGTRRMNPERIGDRPLPSGSGSVASRTLGESRPERGRDPGSAVSILAAVPIDPYARDLVVGEQFVFDDECVEAPLRVTSSSDVPCRLR